MSPNAKTRLTPAARRAFAEQATRTMGLALSVTTAEHFDAAVLRATERSGSIYPEDLLARIMADDAAALEAMAIELTVGETYFFRESRHVAWLRERAIPDLLRRTERGPIRLWSAGCATGEEAYSMAITGLQCLGEGETRRLEVLGTDINPNFLTRAREGRYGEWSFRNVPDTVRATWFSKHGKTWEVQPILKQIVRFAPLNLRVEPGVDPKDWPSRQDIIFCRNVLVYFEAEAARRTLEQLGTCLQPGGWLVTGSTDPHFANIPGLNVVHEPELIAYQRPSGRPPMLATDAERPPIERPSWVAPPVVPKREPSPPPERAEALGPPAIAAADLLGEAKAFADRGETEHAMELLEMKLQRDALDPGVYLLRASLRMSQGQPAAAADDARAAVLLDRRLAMAHVLMAVARAELGETAGARRAIKSAQDLLRAMPDPEAEVVHSGGATVGQLLATCSRLKSALGDARRTGRRSPR